MPVDLKVYPEATHSFLAQYTGPLGVLIRVQGMSHDPEASADAWDRTLGFFAEHLGVPGAPRGDRATSGWPPTD